MMLAEEIRVITENPYEFEGDDEELFRAMMPHEMRERRGVLSVQPHPMQVCACVRVRVRASMCTCAEQAIECKRARPDAAATLRSCHAKVYVHCGEAVLVHAVGNLCTSTRTHAGPQHMY